MLISKDGASIRFGDALLACDQKAFAVDRPFVDSMGSLRRCHSSVHTVTAATGVAFKDDLGVLG